MRPIENTDEYEVISGHRRLHAAEKAGLETVPALIYAISRDEAAVMLVDSNLHREHILPSEKAFAYKLKMDALNSRGCRSDLTSSQVATKLDSAAEIGKESGESRDTVFRYIRLTYLIPQLLDLMQLKSQASRLFPSSLSGFSIKYLFVDLGHLIEMLKKSSAFSLQLAKVRLDKSN